VIKSAVSRSGTPPALTGIETTAGQQPVQPPFGHFKDVHKTFTRAGQAPLAAIDMVSFDLHIGKFISLLGPSGCGKTTFLRIAAGLIPKTSGIVQINGIDVDAPQPDFGIAFQQPNLMPWRTVLRNVLFPLEITGGARGEAAERATNLLALVGLSGFENSYPAQLSGGMQQRVALCRALVHRPKLLLMDEPFGALDEQTRMILGEDLSVLLARTEKTIVFVTHSLGEAVFLADRVAVFSARPGTIKKIIQVDEPHPRKPEFVTSEKFAALRNELYALLHDEIRKAVAEAAAARDSGATGMAS
jgi:NitT/TauT family transport system ATP-binding protein